jgi:N-acetylglucosamine kinase-like BadF-type ATPase
MLFLGIDGGGTKTKVFVIDENKTVIYEGESGPSSIDTVEASVTLKNINNCLVDFFKNPEYKNKTFTSVFAGLGGVPDELAQEVLKSIIIKVDGVTKDSLVFARSDMENALASGLCFDEGITLIAGTGMVAFGKTKDGKTHRAGGLGYKEGDFGSSYSLGLMAIQMVARTLDYRYPKTPFTTELAEYLNLNTPADVARLAEDWHTERTKVASLAPFVTKHANLGDSLATKICDKMSYELAIAVRAIYETLKIKKPTLVVVGSLGNVRGYFKDKLHEQILAFAPDINIISPKVDPAHAAALLAHKYYYNK